MPNYGPYSAKLDRAGDVLLKIEAGPDPVVSCNAGIFKKNASPPPPFTPVKNPWWPHLQTASNVLGAVSTTLGAGGTELDQCQLVVLVGMTVNAPNPDPNFEYTAFISLKQAGTDRVDLGQGQKGPIEVRLKNSDLPNWHQFAIDMSVLP